MLGFLVTCPLSVVRDFFFAGLVRSSRMLHARSAVLSHSCIVSARFDTIHACDDEEEDDCVFCYYIFAENHCCRLLML